LSNNQVSSFPIELCSLDQLRKLDLSPSIHSSILPSAIGQMTSLIELRLEQTGLRELPVEIGSLQSLVILAVLYVPLCADVDCHPCSQTSLRYPQLEKNRLRVLPSSIGQLRSSEAFEGVHQHAV
jgi:Leucine-rich repeat (LRR) protein